MGTPNSEYSQEVIDMVRAIKFEGKELDWADYQKMGLDVDYLRCAERTVFPHLRNLQGFKPLEDMMTPWDRGRFKKLVRMTNYSKEHCLRISRPHPVEEDRSLPLFSLVPIGSGSSIELEVFLTRNSKWIVYRGSNFPNDANIFTKHDTVQELCDRLAQLNTRSTSHAISRRTYVFDIADFIVGSLQATIDAREAAAAAQRTSVDQWQSFKRSL